MLSGQEARPGKARIAVNASATALGGPGEFGYLWWPTMHCKPFSVIGQVAKASWPVRPNHLSLVNGVVLDMGRIDETDQHVHVEQAAGHGDSSRS